jgi:hypothetical protein
MQTKISFKTKKAPPHIRGAPKVKKGYETPKTLFTTNLKKKLE